MGKKELQWTPLLGQYMTLSGAVFVDRGNNARAVSSLRAAAERMRSESMALWMFPEGTRSMREQPDLLPFKKGAFHLAVQAGVPIVPIVCENYWHLYRKNVFESGTLKLRGKTTLLFSCVLANFMLPVLKPIPTADLTTEDVGVLANRVREEMLATLREISDHSSTAASARERTPRPKSPEVEPKTVVDERVPPAPLPVMKDFSHESLASSTSSLSGRRRQESASGAETEEDEGMVLVGRPPA
jgi:lysophosphatidate acyltransferase